MAGTPACGEPIRAAPSRAAGRVAMVKNLIKKQSSPNPGNRPAVNAFIPPYRSIPAGDPGRMLPVPGHPGNGTGCTGRNEQ